MHTGTCVCICYVLNLYGLHNIFYWINDTIRIVVYRINVSTIRIVSYHNILNTYTVDFTAPPSPSHLPMCLSYLLNTCPYHFPTLRCPCNDFIHILSSYTPILTSSFPLSMSNNDKIFIFSIAPFQQHRCSWHCTVSL